MIQRLHPIPAGPRAALGSVLVALATCSSLLALTGLLVRGTWLSTSCIVVLVVAAVVIGVRAVTRSWWAPSLAGFIVSVALVLVRYGAPPGRVQVLPDTGSFDRTLGVVREGVALINASLVPMTGARSVELLVVTGALAVFLLADLVAIGLGAPAASGLVLMTLWIPAVVLGFPASSWALGWTALCYLMLLALSAAPASAHSDRGRRASVAVLASVSLIVSAVVIGPAVAAFPGWASVSLPTFGSGAVGPLHLSDTLDLRESLGTRSGQVVLRYTVSAVKTDPTTPADPAASPSADAIAGVTARTVGPLRAFTLADFDGSTWQRTDALALQPWDPATLLTSDPDIRGTLPNASRGTLADLSVDVVGLREQRLPITTFPRTVVVPGTWEYDDARDEVVGRASTFNGLSYEMQVEIPDLTKADLVAASVGDPGDGGATLAVPDTSHRDDIVALAREITKTATTPYQQAMALQSYFRSTNNFTYDTRVAPSRSDDAVWDFLQSTHGYCVQFATSMTMMARTLGIPARVAVGFLPGQPADDGTYVVTGHESHAWPELYFENVGWVRFEPTPAIQTGAPPAWSDPFAGANTPGINLGDEGLIPATPGATTAPAPNTPGRGTTTKTSSSAWLPVGITVGVVLVVASLGLILVRRRASLLPDLTPERAWARARRALGQRGVVWSDSDTPRTVVASVQGQLRAMTGAELTGPAALALESLARTIESERYARQRPQVEPATLALWLEELTGGVETLISDRPRHDAVPSAPRDGS